MGLFLHKTQQLYKVWDSKKKVRQLKFKSLFMGAYRGW